MSGYEIATIIISIFSIGMSMLAIFVSLIPYKNKIFFKVEINPFERDGLKIKFMIINKSNNEFCISKLFVRKGVEVQIFEEEDYIKKVMPNSSEIFFIDLEKLKFDSVNFKEIFKDKNIKFPKVKNVEFCVIDSVMKCRTFKIRIRDFLNFIEINNIAKKIDNRELTEEDAEQFVKEISYYTYKNKRKL